MPPEPWFDSDPDGLLVAEDGRRVCDGECRESGGRKSKASGFPKIGVASSLFWASFASAALASLYLWLRVTLGRPGCGDVGFILAHLHEGEFCDDDFASQIIGVMSVFVALAFAVAAFSWVRRTRPESWSDRREWLRSVQNDARRENASIVLIFLLAATCGGLVVAYGLYVAKVGLDDGRAMIALSLLFMYGIVAVLPSMVDWSENVSLAAYATSFRSLVAIESVALRESLPSPPSSVLARRLPAPREAPARGSVMRVLVRLGSYLSGVTQDRQWGRCGRLRNWLGLVTGADAAAAMVVAVLYNSFPLGLLFYSRGVNVAEVVTVFAIGIVAVFPCGLLLQKCIYSLSAPSIDVPYVGRLRFAAIVLPVTLIPLVALLVVQAVLMYFAAWVSGISEFRGFMWVCLVVGWLSVPLMAAMFLWGVRESHPRFFRGHYMMAFSKARQDRAENFKRHSRRGGDRREIADREVIVALVIDELVQEEISHDQSLRGGRGLQDDGDHSYRSRREILIKEVERAVGHSLPGLPEAPEYRDGIAAYPSVPW